MSNQNETETKLECECPPMTDQEEIDRMHEEFAQMDEETKHINYNINKNIDYDTNNFFKLMGYSNIDPSTLEVGDQIRYTTNIFNSTERKVVFCIVKKLFPSGDIAVGCYTPKGLIPSVKDWGIEINSEKKEFCFYKK